MKLDDNYTIDRDSSGWVLTKCVVSDKINEKTGKHMVHTDKTYHTRLEDGLQYYIEVAMYPDNTVTELLTKVRNIKQFVRDFVAANCTKRERFNAKYDES